MNHVNDAKKWTSVTNMIVAANKSKSVWSVWSVVDQVD